MLQHQYSETKYEKRSTLKDFGVSFKSILKLRSPKPIKERKIESANKSKKRNTAENNLKYAFDGVGYCEEIGSITESPSITPSTNPGGHNSAESIVQANNIALNKLLRDDNKSRTDGHSIREQKKPQRTSILLRKISSTILRSKSSMLGDSSSDISRIKNTSISKKLSSQLKQEGEMNADIAHRFQFDSDSDSDSDRNWLSESKRVLPSRTRSLHYASMFKPQISPSEPPKKDPTTQTNNPFVLNRFSFDDNKEIAEVEGVISRYSPISNPQITSDTYVEDTTPLSGLSSMFILRSVSSESTIEMDDNVIDIVGSARRILSNTPSIAVVKSFDVNAPMGVTTTAGYEAHYAEAANVYSKQSSDETLISSKNSISAENYASSNETHSESENENEPKNNYGPIDVRSGLLSDIKISGDFSFNMERRFSVTSFEFSNPLYRLHETPKLERNSIKHVTDFSLLSFSSFDSPNPKQLSSIDLYNDSIEMKSSDEIAEFKRNTNIGVNTVAFESSESSNSSGSLDFDRWVGVGVDQESRNRNATKNEFTSVIQKQGLSSLVNNGPSLPKNTSFKKKLTLKYAYPDSIRSKTSQGELSYVEDKVSIVKIPNFQIFSESPTQTNSAPRSQAAEPKEPMLSNHKHELGCDSKTISNNLLAAQNDVKTAPVNCQNASNVTQSNTAEKEEINLTADTLNSSAEIPKPKKKKSRVFKCLNFRFDETVTVYETFDHEQYDRSGFPVLKITPELAYEIKRELNEYKFYEMPIHKESVIHTHYIL